MNEGKKPLRLVDLVDMESSQARQLIEKARARKGDDWEIDDCRETELDSIRLDLASEMRESLSVSALRGALLNESKEFIVRTAHIPPVEERDEIIDSAVRLSELALRERNFHLTRLLSDVTEVAQQGLIDKKRIEGIVQILK